MQRLTIIGNIGKDAEVKSYQNNQFVTFSVAVTTKRKNGEQTFESTNWYDCSFDNVKLAEYLKSGTKVYIDGGFKVDLYFSEKTNKWIPKVNVFVNTIELISAKKADSDNPQAPPQSVIQAFESNAQNNGDAPF